VKIVKTLAIIYQGVSQKPLLATMNMSISNISSLLQTAGKGQPAFGMDEKQHPK
jgi:hypothetical protein